MERRVAAPDRRLRKRFAAANSRGMVVEGFETAAGPCPPSASGRRDRNRPHSPTSRPPPRACRWCGNRGPAALHPTSFPPPRGSRVGKPRTGVRSGRIGGPHVGAAVIRADAPVPGAFRGTLRPGRFSRMATAGIPPFFDAVGFVQFKRGRRPRSWSRASPVPFPTFTPPPGDAGVAGRTCPRTVARLESSGGSLDNDMELGIIARNHAS